MHWLTRGSTCIAARRPSHKTRLYDRYLERVSMLLNPHCLRRLRHDHQPLAKATSVQFEADLKYVNDRRIGPDLRRR
jgi:hypothetical protein